jgi:RimJ/RimL family protein N-acetyltransferase
MALLTFIGATTWSERGVPPAGIDHGDARPDQALVLKPFAPVDLGRLERWLEEPHLARFWLSGKGDRATRLLRQRSRFIEAMEIAWLAPFIIRLGEVPVGALLLRHVNAMPCWQSHGASAETVGIDLFLGEARLLGQGLGRRAISLAGQAAFSDQEVRALLADPHPRNTAAVRAFRAVGFREDGHFVAPSGPALRMALIRPAR